MKNAKKIVDYFIYDLVTKEKKYVKILVYGFMVLYILLIYSDIFGRCFY